MGRQLILLIKLSITITLNRNAQLETQYNISDIFAEGNFAHVRKATKKQSNVDFAMKVISKSKIQRREQIDNEISIMQRYSRSCKHARLLRCYRLCNTEMLHLFDNI